jgi:hypothetical protein
MTEEKRLAMVIARVIALNGNAVSIKPALVATEAMRELDPRRIAPMLVYSGCHLQLRQIARGQLRNKYDPEKEKPEEHDLFPDLQRRYPTARTDQTDDPEYVLLEHLSINDIEYNVARLRSEGHAKLAHADALEAYAAERPKPGEVA